jgi:hypothetical protein
LGNSVYNKFTRRNEIRCEELYNYESKKNHYIRFRALFQKILREREKKTRQISVFSYKLIILFLISMSWNGTEIEHFTAAYSCASIKKKEEETRHDSDKWVDKNKWRENKSRSNSRNCY